MLEMKPPRMPKSKSVVMFDEHSRREYLTGFQKRRKQRKRKAKLEKMKLEKEARKKMKDEKKEEIQQKLIAYGLHVKAVKEGASTVNNPESNKGPSQSCSTYEDHPNHTVIINTKPDFGKSLSTSP